MSGVLRVQGEAMATTAQFLAQQADDLDNELGDITSRWNELSSTWTGKAASAYEPAWDEWHDNAQKVVAILHEHSDLLKQALSMALEHESQASSQLGSVAPDGPL